MAEERANRETEEPEAPSRPARSPRKKKKKRGCGCLFLILLLIGAAFGVHLSGAVDLKGPLVRAIWSLPVVGPVVGEKLNLKKDIPLSTEERLLAELEEREGLLRQQRLEMAAEEESLQALAAELAEKAQALAEKEELLSEGLKVEAERPDITKEELLESVGKIFQEMSSRKAAKIIEELDERLAVTLLKGLPQDKSAEILGSMDAPRAARLTEQLASVRSAR